jgi:hypothetical protein
MNYYFQRIDFAAGTVKTVLVLVPLMRNKLGFVPL